jgi:hypothetical protein
MSRGYLSPLEKCTFYAGPKIIGRLVDLLRVDPAA